MRNSVRGVAVLAFFVAAFAAPTVAQSQGSITGRVADSTGKPVPASVHLVGTSIGAYAGADGTYELRPLPAGSYKLETKFPGFTTDTFAFSVADGQSIRHSVVLRKGNAATLETVHITSPRLNETREAALEEQKIDEQIVTVLSGDEIRALPNANAAEAAARMPGVTSERDEGEGKFVEIRGTPPAFTNVEIDGVHIPGTLGGDRSVKLDDVPSDLLGAIEVYKTLTADQDANAIGGTINLVSKIPEGAPRGYVYGQYAYQVLENNNNGTGTFTYGGRIGDHRQWGFLLGGSVDRTDRVIEDVEPSYNADYLQGGQFTQIPNGSAFNHVYPSSFSQREYNYYRTRYGLDGDLDYRFSAHSSVFVRGLWSMFADQANRWETSVGGGGDTLINNVPTSQGAGVQKTVTNRGPIEHTWGFTTGGKHPVGIADLNWDAHYAGSTATTHDHLQDTWNGPGFNYTYDNSRLVPRYFLSAADAASVANPANYTWATHEIENEDIDGSVVGGRLDLHIPYTIGELPASTQFGAKYQNEHKGYTLNDPVYDYNGASPITMDQGFQSNYSVHNFYGHICPGCYPIYPLPSLSAGQTYYRNNTSQFALESGTAQANNLASFSGTEQVTAGYVMQTLDVNKFHFNIGLRAENTEVGYVAHASLTPDDTLAAATVRGNHSYTDLFPSIHVKYALDDNTNLRAAFTRGIARPDYSALAPTFSAVGATFDSRSQGLSAGNPALLPEHSWNTDLLAEHFFHGVAGVISGGFFYKDISDFFFDRTVVYNGPIARYNSAANGDTIYYVTQPQNGPSAHLWGVEFDYQQHLTFLPGALQGIGFDVNWTHVESRAAVPLDTTVTYTDQNGNTVHPYTSAFRHSPIPRQFPNIFNVALLYDYAGITARVSGQYTAASIYGYGSDGTSNPASGDQYNYEHWQIDASVTWNFWKETAIQVQALNLNNETFGFFTGTPGNRYNNQREYYGTTWSVGLRQGF